MATHKPMNVETAEHYVWGQNCDGWYLVNTPPLTIIQERMPARTDEQYHRHQRAQQYFYILSGEAVFDMGSERVTVGSGEGIHILPGQGHRIRNQTDQELLFIVTSQPSTTGDREVFTGD